MAKLVHWEVPVLWLDDEEKAEQFEDIGVEPETHEGVATLSVNHIRSYNPNTGRNTTVVRFRDSQVYEVNIPYDIFKVKCAEKVDECNSTIDTINHY